MREGLGSLTVRGRAFIAAGLTMIVVAMSSGHGSVIRIGVLVAVLPLITAWWVGRAQLRLGLTRVVTPLTVTVGQSATVHLTVTNEGRMPTGVLLLDERLPYVLGTRPRFVLEGLGGGRVRQASYPLRAELRGQYDIGPMAVRVSDPFGLVELKRSFKASTRLTVTPRTVTLPRVALGGAWTGSGENRPRAFATGSAEDVTVREYRRGDDLRRVHWRSSARTGELMVRREEQPWQSRATVYLDNRRSAHRGQGAAGSWESAVSMAASVAVHLVQNGFAVRLITASGESHQAEWHALSSTASTAPLLETLAVVDLTNKPVPENQWLAEPGIGGITVGVFGALFDTDAAFLRRLRHHASAGLALALRVDEWTPRDTPRPGLDSPRQLAATGWHSTEVGPRDRLDVAWQSLGRSRASGQAPAGAAT